jgi:hypothetical protein
MHQQQKQQPLQNSHTMQLSSLTFSQMVGKYITHANVLNNVSKKYNRMDFLKHLGKCNEILHWLEKNHYDVGTEALCKILCRYRENLFGILPHTLNTSYRTSLIKVTQIMTAAECGLRGEKIEIHHL